MADVHITFLADGTPQFNPPGGFAVGPETLAVTFSTSHDCLLTFEDQKPHLGPTFIATAADVDFATPDYPVALALPLAVGQLCHVTAVPDNGLAKPPQVAYPIHIVKNVVAPLTNPYVVLKEENGELVWEPPTPLRVGGSPTAVTFTVARNCHFTMKNVLTKNPVFIAQQVVMESGKTAYPIGLVVPLSNNTCSITAHVGTEPGDGDPPPYDIIIGDGAEHHHLPYQAHRHHKHE